MKFDEMDLSYVKGCLNAASTTLTTEIPISFVLAFQRLKLLFHSGSPIVARICDEWADAFQIAVAHLNGKPVDSDVWGELKAILDLAVLLADRELKVNLDPAVQLASCAKRGVDSGVNSAVTTNAGAQKNQKSEPSRQTSRDFKLCRDPFQKRAVGKLVTMVDEAAAVAAAVAAASAAAAAANAVSIAAVSAAANAVSVAALARETAFAARTRIPPRPLPKARVSRPIGPSNYFLPVGYLHSCAFMNCPGGAPAGGGEDSTSGGSSSSGNGGGGSEQDDSGGSSGAPAAAAAAEAVPVTVAAVVCSGWQQPRSFQPSCALVDDINDMPFTTPLSAQIAEW